MTSVEQPQPYPGDGGVVETFTFRKVYRDSKGRPASGKLTIRDQRDRTSSYDVIDGAVDLVFLPGIYRLLAVLVDGDGETFYEREVLPL